MATQANIKTLKDMMDGYHDEMEVAVIGAGGIGSHFCRILHKLITGKQIYKAAYGNSADFAQHVDVYDFDSVSEGNLLHQDFQANEVFAPKCIIMGIRYGFSPKCERFTEKHLDEYNLFIVCADNPGVRAMVYRHVDAYNKSNKVFRKYFIDMRSEGDMVAVFTDKAPLDTLLESLGSDDNTRNSTAGRSCQLAADTTRGQIQMGNFLIPVIGAQVLLKMVRGENYPANVIQSVV